MSPRSLNARLAKKHRTYTVTELAELFGVHKNTVRAWQSAGLASVDARKPAIFRGQDVADFLNNRRASRKQPLRPGEIYCLGCRSPKIPALRMATYVPITESNGNLKGLCPDCERFIYRRISVVGLRLCEGILEVENTDAPARLRDVPTPTLNCDLKKG